MSEAQVTEVPSSLETQGGNASAGTMLRQSREKAGLHIAALAVALKIPTRKLEALEADRYDDLPDAVFIRALALSVCRHLKIDPEPILRSLPQTNKPRLTPDEAGMKVPFERPGQASGAAAFWGQLPRPAWVTALLLLVGAAVVVLLPEDALQTLTAPTSASPEVPVAEAAPVSAPVPGPAPLLPAPAITGSPAVAEADAAGRVAPIAASVQPAAPVAAPAVAPAQVPKPLAGAAPAAAPTTTAVTPVDSAAASRQTVQFKTRATSWVEVVDAAGTVLLRRNLEAGENVGVSGAMPLAVVVGRVDATDVWVRGKPFALQNLSNDNVARFEVKP